LKNATPPNITIKAKAWDFLSYLAYETVGQIVDLAFILRRDKSANNDMKDALERNITPRQLSFNGNSSQVSCDIYKFLNVEELMCY
jgi:hypothetical protein